jgi:hypothetical protein
VGVAVVEGFVSFLGRRHAAVMAEDRRDGDGKRDLREECEKGMGGLLAELQDIGRADA